MFLEYKNIKESTQEGIRIDVAQPKIKHGNSFSTKTKRHLPSLFPSLKNKLNRLKSAYKGTLRQCLYFNLFSAYCCFYLTVEKRVQDKLPVIKTMHT
jgi:hypothetical protein